MTVHFNSDFFNQNPTTQLPVVERLDAICASVSSNPNLILQAQPGAGKTTIVPLALLHLLNDKQKILVLEPRRLAARNAAARMADIIGEKIGQTVGYRIRHQIKVSDATRIEVITEGILTRMLQSDPELPGVGLIIFDEFHERNLDGDLGLAFALESQQALREDLKILVMSATLDTQSVAALLNHPPVIDCPGRSFPVTFEYLPPKRNQDWRHCLLAAVQKIFSIKGLPHQDDILVFLPGKAEIEIAAELLQSVSQAAQPIKICQLYGNLPFETQRQVLLPDRQNRKIILSTNLAETSVTIEGVGYVIDSGLMRQSQFDPNVGFDRLVTRKISHASAIQRQGRAGRLGPGHCIRLWSESDSLRLESQAEILRADLSGFALEIAQWGCESPQDVALIDTPNLGAYEQARSLLRSLDAIDSRNKITAHGKKLLKLGIHPRIGHMLVKSIGFDCVELACLMAASLEEKDLLVGEAARDPDYLRRVQVLLDGKNNRRLDNIRKQAKTLSRKLSTSTSNDKLQSRANEGRNEGRSQSWIDIAPVLLALAFPDRIAQQRGNGYRLANGSGVTVADDFSLSDEFLVVVKLGGQGNTPRIFQAAALDKARLESVFKDNLIIDKQVYWEAKSQSVIAEKQTRFGALVISKQPMDDLEPELIIDGLLEGIRKNGLSVLPWSKALQHWLARITLLKNLTRFEDEFPDVSEATLLATLEDWLAPYLSGMTKLKQITNDVLSQAVKGLLDWSQQQKLDALMPPTIQVPSGSTIKIDYCSGDRPVLAVKLQEMFGVHTSPTLAAGEIKLVIHLLSPAQRPLQVTDDLASFWINGYQQAKKEMKGRYPKHPWPDDPLTAEATRFTKKRRH